MEDFSVPGGARLPKNFITPWVLLVLKQWNLHGYLILQQLNQMGFADVDHATLYRELRRLEKEGFVASEWETGGSGPRQACVQHHLFGRGDAARLDRRGVRIPAHDQRLL